MTEPPDRQRRWRSRLCWAGAFTVPFVVMLAWIVVARQADPRGGDAELWSLPAGLVSGLGFVLALPNPCAYRILFGVLYAAVMAAALFVAAFFFVCTAYAPCMRLF